MKEFSPVGGIPSTDFTSVYGDAFISGFTQGGEFTALVSIKLRDPQKKDEARHVLLTHLGAPPSSEDTGIGFSGEIDGEVTF